MLIVVDATSTATLCRSKVRDFFPHLNVSHGWMKKNDYERSLEFSKDRANESKRFT